VFESPDKNLALTRAADITILLEVFGKKFQGGGKTEKKDLGSIFFLRQLWLD
jgi:hypothetical protein